jgi:hypothetical protein
VASVTAVLRGAFPGVDVQVDEPSVEGPGVGFGIEVPGACVHGYVTQTARAVGTGGLVRDGGCLALAGH